MSSGEWAREFARKYLDDIMGSQNPEDHAAKWFDAARRHGIEEAAVEAIRVVGSVGPRVSGLAVATRIRSLASSSPARI